MVIKRSDYLVLARAEIKRTVAALGSLEKLLESALADIEKAEAEQKRQRKLFGKRPR